MSEAPFILRGRDELGAIINRVTTQLNHARDAKAKAKSEAGVAAFPAQLQALREALDRLRDELADDEPDADSLALVAAGASAALRPVMETYPQVEARARQHAGIVVSLEPAVVALAEGCELMMELNRGYEQRHLRSMAAAISRAKPRSFSGDAMLARSAQKRAVPSQQRGVSAGPGKRRGGGKRGKGRGGKT